MKVEKLLASEKEHIVVLKLWVRTHCRVTHSFPRVFNINECIKKFINVFKDDFSIKFLTPMS